MPRCRACRASASAAPRPFTVGTESSTIVQPRFPDGQVTSVGLGRGRAGGAAVDVVPVVVGAEVVGSGGVTVDSAVVGRSCVLTTVSLAELELSASQTADTTPAPVATSRARRAGQTQSPGYQPSRRRQAEPRNPTTPDAPARRSPHSRQYSCRSACGVPQRGQRRSSSGRATSAPRGRRRARSCDPTRALSALRSRAPLRRPPRALALPGALLL